MQKHQVCAVLVFSKPRAPKVGEVAYLSHGAVIVVIVIIIVFVIDQ